MKSFIVIALFMAAVAALPVDKDASIIQYDSNNTGIGGYNYRYETSNGIVSNEEGQLKNVGTDNEVLEVRGSFQYTAENGVVYSVTYVANENGFQAFGSHLPQAPQ